MHLEIDFDWRDAGGFTVDSGMLRFPPVGYVPGVYSIDLGERLYIGEADRLQRRFQDYRTPGGDPATSKPRTNRRVSRAIVARLLDGDAKISICVAAEISVDGQRWALDLQQKTSRLLIENAAVAAARLAGRRLVNLVAD